MSRKLLPGMTLLALLALLCAAGCAKDSATSNGDSDTTTNSNASHDPAPATVEYHWYALAMPILPGKEEAAKAFCKQACTTRLEAVKDYGKSTHMMGEYMCFQASPKPGEVPAMICLWQRVGADHMKLWMESESETSKWVIDSVKDLSGMDLKAMMADPEMKPNQFVGYRETGESMDGAQTAVLCFPVLPGMTEKWLAACAVLWSDEKKAEWMESRKAFGVVAEGCFLQHTPNGDFAIVLHRARDLSKMMPAMWASTNKFDVWFKENVLPCHGLDTTKPMPPMPANEFLGEWWVE
ncbi:MAG: hypothetical protein AB7K09_06940 [Planctomycetota bacterium]